MCVPARINWGFPTLWKYQGQEQRGKMHIYIHTHKYACVYTHTHTHTHTHRCMQIIHGAFQAALVVKNWSSSAGNLGLIPGSGRSPGEGNGNPLQCSCLGNPTEGGAWRATVHGVIKELDIIEHTHTHTHKSNICKSKQQLQSRNPDKNEQH